MKSDHYPDPIELEVLGCRVAVDEAIGHLTVEHDGAITWDQLQDIKCQIWGNDARAIEVYPARSQVVNNGNFRHLWRLGSADFCPDLLGRTETTDALERRFHSAWRGRNA